MSAIIHLAVTLLLFVSVVFLLSTVRHLCRCIDIHEQRLDAQRERVDALSTRLDISNLRMSVILSSNKENQ